MNRNLTITGLVILLIIAAAVFFYAKSNSNTQTTSDTAATATATPDAMMSMDMSPSPESSMEASPVASDSATNVKAFTVTGSNFKFEPSTISVKKGDTVKITFTNSGGFHNFMLDEFKVASKTIGSGATDTVTFVADKTGSFEYYCGVGNHRQMGMKGTLVVQ